MLLVLARHGEGLDCKWLDVVYVDDDDDDNQGQSNNKNVTTNDSFACHRNHSSVFCFFTSNTWSVSAFPAKSILGGRRPDT